MGTAKGGDAGLRRKSALRANGPKILCVLLGIKRAEEDGAIVV
jgi:hypothetical protein